MSGFSTIAGIVAGYKAGQVTEQAANKLLRELGCDDEISSLLCFAAGLAGAIVFGNAIGDAVDDIFGDLF